MVSGSPGILTQSSVVSQPLPLMRPLLMGWQKSKMPESAAVLASTDDCVFLWNVYLFSFMLVFDFSMHLLTSPNALEALPGASTMSLYLLDTPWCPGKGLGRGVHLKLLAPFPSLSRSWACGTEERAVLGQKWPPALVQQARGREEVSNYTKARV